MVWKVGAVGAMFFLLEAWRRLWGDLRVVIQYLKGSCN